ncbi:Hypothetical protein A7982_10083 [Minicystis rosea]|nr:Hypothetical protein A7982_10083 [Minicystis rosea]
MRRVSRWRARGAQLPCTNRGSCPRAGLPHRIDELERALHPVLRQPLRELVAQVLETSCEAPARPQRSPVAEAPGQITREDVPPNGCLLSVPATTVLRSGGVLRRRAPPSTACPRDRTIPAARSCARGIAGLSSARHAPDPVRPVAGVAA